MTKKIFIYFSLFSASPFVTNGASFNLAGSNFKGVIDEVISVISLLLPILYGLCFIAFFWGLAKFILNSGSATEVQKGKTYMIWGVVALFVLISLRAIVGIIAKDLDIGDASVIPIVPTSTNTTGTDTSTFSLPAGVP